MAGLAMSGPRPIADLSCRGRIGRRVPLTDNDADTISNCPSIRRQPVSEKFGLIDVRSLSKCERVRLMAQKLDLEWSVILSRI
jgi:hypothetical protein